MIINGKSLLSLAPIKDMVDHKVQAKPTSWGLTECGYDIRLAEDIHFYENRIYIRKTGDHIPTVIQDRFVLGSSMEYFQMPNNLMGRVLNKSTWARQGIDASLTTNIEPGWCGHLTIELVFNRRGDIHIPAGSGICQIIFEEILEPTTYKGKYQNQEAGAQEAR